MANRLNLNRTPAIIAAILLFLELQPYFIWGIGGTVMLLTITIPFYFILLLNARSKNIYFALGFAIIALLAAICEGDNFFGCIAFILISCLFLCEDYLRDVFRYFKSLYVCIITISVVVWILVMCGFAIPVKIIQPLNTLKDISYNQYPFLVMLGYDSDFTIYRAFRFCGLFDEPGVVGTLAILMLLADRYNLRKPANIILFISGLISMSLFFYLCSFIYIIYSIFLTKGDIGVKIVSIVLISGLAIASYNIDVTYAAIWERLEFDKTSSTFSGNNRADEDLQRFVVSIRGTESYWFGVHNREIIERYSGSASIQNSLIKHGLLGVLFYALFFILYANKKINKKSDAFFCLVFLFITLWQRPGLYSLPYVFMYIILIVNFGRRDTAAALEQHERLSIV